MKKAVLRSIGMQKKGSWWIGSLLSLFATVLLVLLPSPSDIHQLSRNSTSSCMSQVELKNFIRPLPLPSMFLHAIDKYEKIHASCYNQIDLTNALLHPDPRSKCKYLVHIETDGLGNRILTLASAFVYSLLTHRVLLVDPRGHLARLLCEPFRNSSWLLPSDFPYHYLYKAQALRTSTVNGNILRLRFIDQPSSSKKFFCHDTRAQVESVKWVVWSGNLYTIPRLFMLPEFWKPLIKLFPDPSLTFAHVVRFLVLPQDRIWDTIVRVRESYFMKPGSKLGLQIRVFDRGAGISNYPTHELVMKCMIGIGVLPSLVDHPIEHQVNSQRRIDVLVASLDKGFYEELKRRYLTQPTLDGTTVAVHTFSYDNVQTESLEQAADALAEMWLLGMSDNIITSAMSTFGYVAQGITGRRPYILNIHGNCSTQACVKGQSMEPCDHQPLFVECEKEQRTKEHTQWIEEHVRACQDTPQGIQLVT